MLRLNAALAGFTADSCKLKITCMSPDNLSLCLGVLSKMIICSDKTAVDNVGFPVLFVAYAAVLL